ncbi:MAG: IS21 family transposase [Candidatus Methanomethylicaceae archaeon]
MVSMYKWHRIRIMRDKGKGIKAIARALGVSKNTVRKYLRSSDPPEFRVRRYTKKVDSFRGQIQGMLKQEYIGTRIYEELLGMGYEGSLSSVYRYLQEYKQEEAVNELSTSRVETSPGQQMQYDWKEWKLPVGDRVVKIYLHEVVLSYSRRKHYSFSLSISSQDVIRAIEAAIFSFGGSARELLIDNAKQMVLTHRSNGVVSYNEEFLRFCGLYGMEPIACAPYRARTKGKAERPFYYLQEHLLRGLSVENLDVFEEKLRVFTEAYNQRVHSSLGESPEQRFVREKEYLKAICPVEPSVLYDRERRQVSNDGYLRYRGGYYPVPMRLCLQEVWVESIFGRKLRIYDRAGKIVSEQTIHLFEDGRRPDHPEHEGINQGYQDKRRAIRSALVGRFYGLFGEIGQRFVLGLRDREQGNLYWHLSEILAFCDLYDLEEIRMGLETCVQIGAYHKNSLLRLLDHRKLKNPPLVSSLPMLGLPGQETKRSLAIYASLQSESIRTEEVCHE